MATDSILDSVKLTLGLTPDNTEFDVDVVMYINTAFANLQQLGIGPTNGFEIDDSNATWQSFFKGDRRFNQAKTYVSLTTRLAFDPPTTGPLMQTIKDTLQELTSRLSLTRENALGTLHFDDDEPPTPGNGGVDGGTPDSDGVDGGSPDTVDFDTVYDGGTP